MHVGVGRGGRKHGLTSHWMAEAWSTCSLCDELSVVCCTWYVDDMYVHTNVYIFVCTHICTLLVSEYLEHFVRCMYVPSLTGAGQEWLWHFNHMLPFAATTIVMCRLQISFSRSFHFIAGTYTVYWILLASWPVKCYCAYVRIYTQCTCTYVWTYVCMHIHIHTHRHTYSRGCVRAYSIKWLPKWLALLAHIVSMHCAKYISAVQPPVCMYVCAWGWKDPTPVQRTHSPRYVHAVLLCMLCILFTLYCSVSPPGVCFLCLYMCTHVLNVCNTYIHTYIHTYMHTTYLRLHKYACTACTYISMYVCMYVCSSYLCMYVCSVRM